MKWKKGIKKYKKKLNSTAVLLYITFCLFVFGNTMFMVAHHNLDLMSNYALLFNDINQIHNCNEEFHDLRELTDCNFYEDCPDYMSIYLESQKIWLYSMLFMNLAIVLLGIHVIEQWKK